MTDRKFTAEDLIRAKIQDALGERTSPEGDSMASVLAEVTV